MDANLQVILQQLQAEKSIERDTLLEAIRSALESAARKSFHHAANVTVEVDENTLSFKVYEIRSVVEEVEDPTRELSTEEARELNPDASVGDRLKVLAEPKDFGRIAAQTAKQVIIQKIRDAERDNVYDEYKKREGELITGVVKRMSHGNLIIGLGRGEAVLPIREQSPRESFKPGDRIRAFLLEVEKSARGPQIVLSRTSPQLVKALFDLEVPEIYDGTIEIKGIAREAGSRTKIAVASNDPNVDAVGACVGMKGSRVRTVVEELCGEKIDIVRWGEDPVEMCGNALNPADILDISVDEDNHSILVIVPHDQLSLAIGKRGQNARLASRLMGWNIDIKSDVELAGGPPPSQESTEEDASSEPAPDSLSETAELEDEAAPVEPADEQESGQDDEEPDVSEDAETSGEPS
ncbi:MAG: transcription termination/antitermination protein NusA [bacterium]|nr:transcription termination/antitermination protein NusA [bacterium]